MRSARFNVSSAALLASVVLASPSLVLAHTEPRAQSAPPPEAIETVIVTAQKRSERLLDVPVAVTSVSGTSLRNAGIADAASLERVAPSLTYATSLGTQYSSVKIRGVGALTTNSGVESSSAFIIDGIGLSRQGQGLSDLIDVASVEVLRGPQGTLFGKGTTAGAVLINMRRPSADLSILADATIAQGDEVRVSASVSGPLSPRVRARLTGFVTDVPGHVLNLYNGKMVNGSQSSGLRAKVEFDVTDSLNVLLSADYNDADSACCILIPRRSTNSVSRALQASVGLVPSTTNTTIWANGDIFNRDRHEGYTAEANLDLGDFKLTSLTGYKRWDTESNADGDNQGVVRPVYTVEVFTLTVSQLDRNFGRTELEQISQELRLASPKDLPLNYVAGVYYGKSTIDRTADRRVGGCFPAPGVVFGAPCPNPVFRSTSQTSGTETTNFAAFGQLNWEAADRLTFLLGLRAQNEKTSFFGTRNLPTIAGDQPLSMPATGKGDTEDSVVTGKLGASYKFAENLNTYFTYTRGYKGAAYDIEQTANFAALKPLLPETVEAYELGLKWASPSGRFGANLAIYQSNFQNLQVETQQPVNGFLSFVLANTGAAKAQGLELEFFARPLPGLSLTGGYAYSDTAFDLDGSICYQLQPVQTLAPGAVPPGNICYRYANDGPMTQARQNIRDGVLTSAPEHRFNMTARFEAPINADFNWFAQSSVRYQSEVRFAIDQNPLSVEKPNAILDASVGIGRSNGRYQLSLFVKNLTNEFYSTGISIDQFVATTASPYELTHFVPKDAKRFFGVNLRFEY